MMKRILLIFSAVIMTTSAAGQDLEISVAPTVNFPVYKALEGGAGHNPGTGFSITFGYLAAQKQFIAWTIGLGYHFVRIKTDPMFNGVYDPLPYTESCSLISFSIGAVSNLRNNFFIAFGPAMDLQLNQKGQRTIERQTGLGFSLSGGKNISLDNNLGLRIRPEIRSHNLIPFQGWDYPLRLLVAGLNIGLIF